MNDVTEIMKRVGLFGVGMWALTEEKIKDIADELVESGEIRKEEGKKFVRDLVEEQQKQKAEMEDKIYSKVQENMKKADMATKEEVMELKDTISRLEEKIDKLMSSHNEDEQDL